MKSDIANFLKEDGRIKSWPSKKEVKRKVLNYIAEKFECGRNYTEKEVNQIIEDWHTFGDYFLIRRELIDSRLLCRTRNGARYWKEEVQQEQGNCRAIMEEKFT